MIVYIFEELNVLVEDGGWIEESHSLRSEAAR